jgi:hypothetical protein
MPGTGRAARIGSDAAPHLQQYLREQSQTVIED